MYFSTVPEKLETLPFPVVLLLEDLVYFANREAKKFFGRLDVEDLPLSFFFEDIAPGVWQEEPHVRAVTCVDRTARAVSVLAVLFSCTIGDATMKGIAIRGSRNDG